MVNRGALKTFVNALNEAEGIDISADFDELEDIIARAEDFTSVSETVSGTGGSASAELDTEGRSNVQIYYDTGGQGTVTIETSNDGSAWRELDTLDVSEENVEPNGDEQFPWIARRYIKAEISGGDGDVLLDIAASR